MDSIGFLFDNTQTRYMIVCYDNIWFEYDFVYLHKCFVHFKSNVCKNDNRKTPIMTKNIEYDTVY